MKETFLDVTICKCPNCGNLFVEPSWFVFELEQDFQCGVCKTVFNTKKSAVNRHLLEFQLDEKGDIKNIEIKKSIY